MALVGKGAVAAALGAVVQVGEGVVVAPLDAVALVGKGAVAAALGAEVLFAKGVVVAPPSAVALIGKGIAAAALGTAALIAKGVVVAAPGAEALDGKSIEAATLDAVDTTGALDTITGARVMPTTGAFPMHMIGLGAASALALLAFGGAATLFGTIAVFFAAAIMAADRIAEALPAARAFWTLVVLLVGARTVPGLLPVCGLGEFTRGAL